jgi:hypothetical protein
MTWTPLSLLAFMLVLFFSGWLSWLPRLSDLLKMSGRVQ